LPRIRAAPRTSSRERAKGEKERLVWQGLEIPRLPFTKADILMSDEMGKKH